MPDRIRPGRYRHYKGKDYEVIGVAMHSETEKELDVYRPVYGKMGLWARPLEMFAGMWRFTIKKACGLST